MKWSCGIIPLFTVFILAVMSGCGEDRSPVSPDAGEGEITFEITYAPWTPLAAKPAAVQKTDRATAYVYTSGGENLLEQDLEIAEGRARGSITVKAQKDLRVTLVFFEGETVTHIGEDADVDVPARGSTKAEITAQYMGTVISAPDSAYVGKEYRLSWQKRPFAETYDVQESPTVDFTDFWGLYFGPDTTFVVPAKEEDDANNQYYYRVRVSTEYGFGPWHGQSSTGIAGEEGTVIIDIPLPPDNSPAKSLRLIAPNGGESFRQSTPFTIAWVSTNIDSVTLELSIDNGKTWKAIVTNVSATSGRYTWTTPGSLSQNCMVRIKDVSGTPEDRSDAAFTITSTVSRYITLLSPNGGEKITGGESLNVRWDSAGNDAVRIELSTNGGASWRMLTPAVADSPRVFIDLAPDLSSPNCLVRVSHPNNTKMADVSASPFTILPAPA
ncbi:MAG: Ser-Thr-rich GPI-anchored membrane family protein, partial [Candidatus Latescibacterota bacterium]